MNAVRKSGRAAMTFAADETLVVSFMGTRTETAKNDLAIEVDQVVLQYPNSGIRPSTIPAEGTCTYARPAAGPSRIHCSATAEGRPYSGTFVSDGKDPSVSEL